jgi:hypothetical protein
MLKKGLRTNIITENDMNYYPQNGDAGTRLYCRFKNHNPAFILEKSSICQTFACVWTPFPLRPEIRVVILANGAFYGVSRSRFPTPSPFRRGITIWYGAFFQYASR